MAQGHGQDDTTPIPPSGGGGKPDISTERLFVGGEEDSIPERIGPYRIRRKIAEGGMGIVFEAMQDSPRRKVALKIIKAGVVSRRELRRFNFESQILGRLRHHGIAQIYESGVHEGPGGSTPYFVMEYIPHPRTILEYATKKHLDLEDRVRLFRKVLEAVHHGHQKGIIHRDLKPGNILVDPSGQPKVIDFGVARATDSDQVATTLQTDVGGIIGTLQYMSPEQFDADPDDLDIRSDVYALGVVLYELVCEELPYDLTSVSLAEAARTVKDDLPSRPSRVNKAVRGDLETIILKALEKDRDRRYQSAMALEDDLERYLHHEPIEARRPSTSYHVRMFARRHTGAFFGLVGIFLLLAGSTIVISILLSRAINAERVAENKAYLADMAQGHASVAKDQAHSRLEEVQRLGIVSAMALKQAEEEGARTSQLYDFMSKHLLRAIDPGTGETDGDAFIADRPFRETIDRAVAAVATEFNGEPELEARVRVNFGESYYNLGEYEQARQQFEEALLLLRMAGADEESTLRLDFQLSMVDADLAETEAELLETHAALEAIHAKQVVALGEDHPDALGTLNVLALVDSALGNQVAAEARLRRVNELVPEGNAHRVSYIMNLGSILGNQGHYEEAIGYMDLAIAEARRFNTEHSLATGMNQKVLFLSYAGKPRAALRICNELLEMNDTRLHEAHPHAINSLGTRVQLLLTLGRNDEAREAVLEIERRLVEHDRRDSEQWLNHLGNRAMLEYRDGKLPEAFEAFRRVEQEYIRLKGTRNPSAVINGVSAAVVLDTMGRSEEGIQQLQRIIDRFPIEEQRTVPAVLGARARLGQAMISVDRLTEAREVLGGVISDHEANGSPFGSEALYARHDMSRAMQRLERYPESIAFSSEVIQRTDDPELKGMALNIRARSRSKSEDFDGARVDFEQSMEILEAAGNPKRTQVIEYYAAMEEGVGNKQRAAELRALIEP